MVVAASVLGMAILAGSISEAGVGFAKAAAVIIVIDVLSSSSSSSQSPASS